MITPQQKAAAIRNAREKLVKDFEDGVDLDPSKEALTKAVIASFDEASRRRWAAEFMMGIVPPGPMFELYLMEYVSQLEEIIEAGLSSKTDEELDYVLGGLKTLDKIDRI
ncbi:protein of unknown function [Pseudomonas sp. JV551A1]|uniref:Uncharacterized protein n=1 Tax=Pseudomonas inefficax TaxID=2078786 RepID=A0AAQ1PAI2_9PSED|nr:hypothetical protein [Pseudomonas]SPO56175.1 protein of unknown function [Pseudomonas sp. JV551A1]SPO62271.1 protein of unknown function [Pseudomonas inefficax]